MNKTLFLFLTISSSALAGTPTLTIYNGKFAVVREEISLDLKKGAQIISYSGATAHIEPDSVLLRDLSKKNSFEILEQNYDANVLSQGLMLSLYEGKTIDFKVTDSKETKILPGKIIRSGYEPHQGAQSYGSEYYMNQVAYTAVAGTPVVEVGGRLQFGLPGTPLFPPLSDSVILKPTISWVVQSPVTLKTAAELAYVTGGMGWDATYNLVSPEKGNEIDLAAWITIDNQTGKDFDEAKVKLMAGDVSKIQNQMGANMMARTELAGMVADKVANVSEKAFDEFHLYTLSRPTSIKDRETKQVEFISASHIQSEQRYIYDGAATDLIRFQGWDPTSLRQNQDAGATSQKKVWVMREFKNSKANQLGVPLPKGKIRFYRQDAEGRLELTGENVIDHTPRDEMVRVYTGNAFDIVGERKRTDYRLDVNGHGLDESFEIKIANRKETDVEVVVAEKLFRWLNWKITSRNHPFIKKASQAIEFAIEVPKNSEKVVTYSVHYSW